MTPAKNAVAKSHMRQPRTSPHRATPIVKSTQVSGTRRSLRSRNKTPVSRAPPAQSVQSSPIPPTSISQTARTKRKRSRDCEAEAERPPKQPRRSPPHLKSLKENLQIDSEARVKIDDLEPPPFPEESQEGLRLLYKEVMDAAVNNASALKRSSSRRSMTLSEVNTARSQRSSNTTAHYRYKHLKNANVYIHVDPPENIQAAIDDIINADPSKDRRAIFRDKAKIFQKRCKEMVRAAAGEDDFVHLFYNVIEDMSPDNLISREKADWRVELKPTIQRSDENLSFLSDFEALGSDEQQGVDDKEVDDASAPPSKRYQQSAGRLYISPQNSQNPLPDSQQDTKPPQPDKAKDTSPIKTPQPDKAKDTSPIKTPRPDITTGVKESAIISALVSSLSSLNFNYTKTKAIKFLETLQDATILSGRDGPLEPALIMVPTQRESNLTFPTLIFEGKGYSTGKQIFEAQNQAAVSGAGGVKIQMILNELVKRVTRSSGVPLTPTKNRPPLVFAICSEGPQHELWAHYAVVEDGEHLFNMVLLSTCHGVMLNQVEGFFVKVDNILNWSAGPFLKSVVDDLGKVAKKSRKARA